MTPNIEPLFYLHLELVNLFFLQEEWRANTPPPAVPSTEPAPTVDARVEEGIGGVDAF